VLAILEQKSRIGRSKPDSTDALIRRVLGRADRPVSIIERSSAIARGFKYTILLAGSNLVINILSNFASAALQPWKFPVTIILVLALLASAVIERRIYEKDH
jgi:hypothetical protein